MQTTLEVNPYVIMAAAFLGKASALPPEITAQYIKSEGLLLRSLLMESAAKHPQYWRAVVELLGREWSAKFKSEMLQYLSPDQQKELLSFIDY